MAMTIDNLEITVNVKSEKAMQKLEKLAQMLKGIGSASSASSGVSKVDEVLKSIANINLSGINAGLRTLSRYLKDIASLDKRLASVASSLQKISGNSKGFGAIPEMGLVPYGGGRTYSGGGSARLLGPSRMLADYYIRNYGGGGFSNNLPPLLGTGTPGGESFIEGIWRDISGSGAAGGGTATSRLNEFSDAFKRIAGYSFEANKNTRSLGKQLKTILIYSTAFRLVGELIKGISEGLKNLAAYSARADSTLSAYNSLWIYTKNSVAAAIYPVIEMLLPLVQNLVYWFGNLANSINIVIAAWRGQSQVIVADEAYWEDYLETVKATQKALLGIDQINKLGSTSDPTKMFKTVDFGGGDIIASWGKIFSAISILIGAGIFTKGIKMFTLLKDPSIMGAVGKIGKTFAAIALVFDGIGNFVSGISDIEKTAQSIEDSFWTAVGALEIGAGIALLIGSWIPLVVGAVVGLFTYLALRGDEVKKYLDDIGTKGSDIIESWKSDSDSLVASIWNGIVSVISWLFRSMTEGLGKIAEGVHKIFQGDFSGAAELLGGALQAFTPAGILNSGLEAIFGPAKQGNFKPNNDLFSSSKAAESAITPIPGFGVALAAGASRGSVSTGDTGLDEALSALSNSLNNGSTTVNIFDEDGELRLSRTISAAELRNRRDGQITFSVGQGG